MQAKFYLGAKNVIPISGNVDTRINKLNSGDYDCIILAEAGCQRLKIDFEKVKLYKVRSSYMCRSGSIGCAI